MKETTLMKIAKDQNFRVSYKRYKYWDHTLFFNNTAICFDIITEQNTNTICSVLETFPKFVTKEYIMNAVKSNAESLGCINYRNKNKFGGKIYFKYNEEVI